MTQKMTIEDLTKRIQELEATREALEAKVEQLSTDPSYGILTRQALDLSLLEKSGEVKFVAFLDVDYLHDLNTKYGHDELNNRIRRSLHVRSTDLVMKPVKWYSGDEVAFLLSGDPEGFCNRQEEAFKAEGMSISIAYVPFSGDLVSDVNAAKKIVFEKKAARGVSER